MKLIVWVILCAVGIGGCAAPGGSPQSVKSSDPRECAQNFTYDGSFLAGRTFKSKATVSDVSKATGVQRAAKYLAQDGWNVTTIDKEVGLITATQTVSYGEGKTAPLSVSVEPQGRDLRVNTTYTISGGVSSPVQAVQKGFCDIIEAVAGK